MNSHILKYQGLGLQHMNVGGGDTIQPLTESVPETSRWSGNS
jgi:hypothetical protein